MKRLEINFEFDANIDGIRGHFEGLTQINPSEFEDVESIIDKIHKTAKKYTTFCITFRMYDSSVYGEGKAYGRIINDWENDSACLGLISWPSINVVESIKTAVNKREIKRFVLDMIQRYKADCEED